MKYLGLSGLLALAACSPGADGIGAPATSGPAASAAPTTIDRATAALDALSRPRQQGKYAPRDDCAGLPGAADFRRKLADAVLSGDAEGIAALASPDIRLGFGGDDGRERFLAQLREPDSERIRELRLLLPLGCAVNAEGDMTTPSYFAQDLGEIDGYAATIVTGEDVPLYEKADASSAVRQRLSWDVVAINNGLYPERLFQQVGAPGGVKGFVETAKLRSLLDYRLIVSRESGEWKITAMVAGD